MNRTLRRAFQGTLLVAVLPLVAIGATSYAKPPAPEPSQPTRIAALDSHELQRLSVPGEAMPLADDPDAGAQGRYKPRPRSLGGYPVKK